MKTKLIITLSVLALFVLNVNARDKVTVTYSNVEIVENGNSKTELITCDEETSTPIKKIVNIEDPNGLLLEKTQYTWNGSDWDGVKKSIYEYNESTQLAALTTTMWNKSNKSWEKKSKKMIYTYDASGNLQGTSLKEVKG